MDMTEMSKEELVKINDKLIQHCEGFIANNKELHARIDEMGEIIKCYQNGDRVKAAEIMQKVILSASTDAPEEE